MKNIAIPKNIETRELELASGALSRLPEALQRNFPGRRALVVADENTWRAAGKSAQEFLTAAGAAPAEPLIFPAVPLPHPEMPLVQRIQAAFFPDCVPVAVGSGVINDLVKCAAGAAGIAYCCVPTAASVDGYTAFGAAMLVDGFKMTVPCPAPLLVLADTQVLATAPAPMLAAGYGDLTAKLVAGADWQIADAIGLQSIDVAVWKLIQGDLRAWLADPTDLGNVFAGLAATGFAMQLYRDSRPASGMEHLFSHVWEMENVTCDGVAASHGFKVAVGTLASARLLDFIRTTPVDTARKLAAPPPSRAEREAQIDRLLVRGCYGAAKAVALKKFIDGAAAAARRETIFAAWEEIGRRIAAQVPPTGELEAMLRRAGCPTTPEAIGLDCEQYRHGIHTAQLIRARYTALDLLYESGLLDAAVQRL